MVVMKVQCRRRKSAWTVGITSSAGEVENIHGLVLIFDLTVTFFGSHRLSSKHLLLFSVFVFYF